MNIGVIQLGRIGDMVLMTPLFDEIKRQFPESNLHVFAGPANYSIILNNPAITKVHIVKKSPFGIISCLLELKLTKFDYWIDPKDHFSKESRLIASLVNAKHKIGFNSPDLKKVFDIPLPENTNLIHHVLIGMNALTPLGFILPEKPPKPVLYTIPESEKYADNFIKNIGKNYVILNISGSGEHKMWDNSCWDEFLSHAETDLPLVLCFAPSEESRALELASKHKSLNIFKTRNINDLVSIVAKCQYLITPDTAIVHIVAAFNKPVFALYSGLDNFYAKFHPLSDIHVSVRANDGDHGIKSIKPVNALKEFERFRMMVEDN